MIHSLYGAIFERTVYELSTSRTRAGAEIVELNECCLEAASRRVQRHARARGAAADHENVKLLRHKAIEQLATGRQRTRRALIELGAYALVGVGNAEITLL